MKHLFKRFCSIVYAYTAIWIIPPTVNGAISVTTSGSGAGGDITITMPAIEFVASDNFTIGQLLMVIDGALPTAGGMQSTTLSGPDFAGFTTYSYYDSGYTGGEISSADPYIAILNNVPAFNTLPVRVVVQPSEMGSNTFPLGRGLAPALGGIRQQKYEQDTQKKERRHHCQNVRTSTH